MTELIIPDELAQRLQNIARRENRPLEAVLESLLEQYEPLRENIITKADQDSANPLTAMDGMFEDEITDLSTTVRETMAKFYKARYGRTD